MGGHRTAACVRCESEASLIGIAHECESLSLYLSLRLWSKVSSPAVGSVDNASSASLASWRGMVSLCTRQYGHLRASTFFVLAPLASCANRDWDSDADGEGAGPRLDRSLSLLHAAQDLRLPG